MEKDIYKEGELFVIKKEIEREIVNFGSFETLEEAIERRNELEEYGWPYLKEKPKDSEFKQIEKHITQKDDYYIVSKFIKNFEIVYGMFDSLKSAKDFKRKLIKNAWNLNFTSRELRYGKYIRKDNNRFIVYRDINGQYTPYNTFKFLDEAIVYRDELIDNNWGMDDSYILSNIGVQELDSIEENIAKIGRKYTVFLWEESKCTFFGFFHTYGEAVNFRDILRHNHFFNVKDLDFGESDKKYIVEVGNSFRISKMIDGKLCHFGHYDSLEKAIELRDKLIKNNWDPTGIIKLRTLKMPKRIKHIHTTSHGYEIVKRIDGNLINFGSFDSLDDAIMLRDELEANNWVLPSDEEEIFEEKYDEFIYLRPDGKYYLKNEINGVMHIFGVFDNGLDAIEARLNCIKNNWSTYSLSEEEYFSEEKNNHSFGSYVDEFNEIEESNIFFNITKDYLSFPVTVGKSYKNGGWAVKRSHLGDFIPTLTYEKECICLIDDLKISGKLNIHTRLFYFKDKELSSYLEKLYNIDPKIQIKVNLDLEYGKYSFNENPNSDFLKINTNFSKSFKNGMFVIPRKLSKEILPILPYESNTLFTINDIEVSGKFNLEFRFIFKDKNIISQLESLKEEGEELEVILLL